MKIDLELLDSLDKTKTYLLACSFGPDSMTLFDILLKNKFDFVVCHVNYHHREEADSEELRLRSYCDQKNIKFYLYNAFFQTEKDDNFQAWARKERYGFFASVYDQIGANGIFVAHQQDDCIETYLMQKYKHKMVAFYGISPSTTILGMNVYRPLLNVSKQETYDYCEVNDIPHTIDSSNLSDEYERNRIRHHEVGPMSKKEREEVLKEVAILNKKADELKKKCDEMFFDYEVLEVEKLKTLTLEELKYVVYRFYSRKLTPAFFKGQYVKEVEKMINSSKPNIRIRLGNEIYIQKEYDEVRIFEQKDIMPYTYFITEPCVLNVPHFKVNLKCQKAHDLIKLSDYPLEIRTAKMGDRYQIKDYFVKVRRLFIDWKMPTYLRKRWPLIVGVDGRIIYIPRYRKDYKKVDEEIFSIK